MDHIALQNRATEIIHPLVPPDAEERVNRSIKQWNQIIRDHIRTETGLKLSDGDSRFTIPVRVVKGFPVKLAELIDQYRDPVVWRLTEATMPYKVVTVFTLKPSAAAEELKRSREALEVFREQHGFVSYEVIRTSPNGLLVIHEWQSKADYGKAMAAAAAMMASSGREAIVVRREVFAGEVVLSSVGVGSQIA